MHICRKQKCNVYYECLQAAPNRPEFPGGSFDLVNLYKNQWQSLAILRIEIIPTGVYNESTIKRKETQNNEKRSKIYQLRKRFLHQVF